MKSSGSRPCRKNESTLAAASFASIHSNPDHSKSTSCSARSCVCSRFKSPISRWIPWWGGEASSDHSTIARFPEFVPRPKLAAHEKQLLAGMREMIAEEKPQIREFLPVVARHFLEQRALPVDHFVVRQRQNEIFVERVEHRESQLAVVMLPVERIERDISQRVVHPAHVPFQIEAQPADVRRARNRRPGSRFFRDRQRAGMPLVQHFIQPLDERDCLQVLAPAVNRWESTRRPCANSRDRAWTRPHPRAAPSM